MGNDCAVGLKFQFCRQKTDSGGWLHNNMSVLNTDSVLSEVAKMANLVCFLPQFFFKAAALIHDCGCLLMGGVTQNKCSQVAHDD